MSALPILLVWAHIGFVITRGLHARRRIAHLCRTWTGLLVILAAGPLVWLLALGEIGRNKPRRVSCTRGRSL
ncbi:hypothetical protein MHM84_08385 [Halomonas sp. McH1-25]|uniref:hypothetical protein n=1 Tax=unclassified Halomonas TaxID=2609666 RepID=UPI001EF71E09|nr:MULTISPECIES: hypothetical protein [unclassified Halomonas]MCG7599802.1 hypothetical protein [Halomonas sp. McH1-25]MCP1341697.1 hypothetical protein [Halomonas sp. FL8]MCP1359855.1 hypothetical protein [Halomonas sp. BBD45]MCP1364439.1 hypothetical protein [Halomonas sp. BBD48]